MCFEREPYEDSRATNVVLRDTGVCLLEENADKLALETGGSA
jgi:hypothetical protein